MEKPNFEAIAEAVAFQALDWVPKGNGEHGLKVRLDPGRGIDRKAVTSTCSLFWDTAARARAELSVEQSLAFSDPVIVDLDSFITRVIARSTGIAQKCIAEESKTSSMKHSELLKTI